MAASTTFYLKTLKKRRKLFVFVAKRISKLILLLKRIATSDFINISSYVMVHIFWLKIIFILQKATTTNESIPKMIGKHIDFHAKFIFKYWHFYTENAEWEYFVQFFFQISSIHFIKLISMVKWSCLCQYFLSFALPFEFYLYASIFPTILSEWLHFNGRKIRKLLFFFLATHQKCLK